MNGVLVMLGMLLAGGVLAGLIAVDIRRHQHRERAAMDWYQPQQPRERDEQKDGGP